MFSIPAIVLLASLMDRFDKFSLRLFLPYLYHLSVTVILDQRGNGITRRVPMSFAHRRSIYGLEAFLPTESHHTLYIRSSKGMKMSSGQDKVPSVLLEQWIMIHNSRLPPTKRLSFITLQSSATFGEHPPTC